MWPNVPTLLRVLVGRGGGGLELVNFWFWPPEGQFLLFFGIIMSSSALGGRGSGER